MSHDTKDRILETTAELFRRHGYTGTGMKQIVRAANAPFGSLYHHFPGGKEALGQEVIRRSGAMYGELFAEIARRADGPLDYVRDVFEGAAQTLVESGYEDACPIATVALEVASTNEPLRVATAEVFQSWLDGWAAYLERVAGIDRERARTLAFELLGAMEGAFVLSRALRSPEPMLVAGAAAVERVREALPA
ncbi:MAG TPA: TetR/AcrR family transcriptional regulator [Solirubrobacteraceae bacterium]|nr:TetR/AcrR family transcriptional regulator [Solirubrobacteraceae bacterium]